MSFKLLFNSDRYGSKRSLVRNRQQTRTLYSSFFSLILDKLTNFWNRNNIILFLSVTLISNIVKVIYYRSKVKKTKRKGSIMTRKKFSMSSTYFDEIYFRPYTQVKRYVCCLIVITLRTAAATDSYRRWWRKYPTPQFETGSNKTADVIGVTHQTFDIRRTNTNC